eukprot:1179843-Prorocentrum_minimum.AAC.3
MNSPAQATDSPSSAIDSPPSAIDSPPSAIDSPPSAIDSPPSAIDSPPSAIDSPPLRKVRGTASERAGRVDISGDDWERGTPIHGWEWEGPHPVHGDLELGFAGARHGGHELVDARLRRVQPALEPLLHRCYLLGGA